MASSTKHDNHSYGRHLALFIPSLAGGGVAKFILNLAKSFASRGHKVDLLLCRLAGPYLDQIPAGVTILCSFKQVQDGVVASVLSQPIIKA
jgi:hypothetical protein